MARLTVKDKTNEKEPKDIYFISQKTNDFSGNNQHIANQKLGQLEDIEDKLGVDLITLFKALLNGYYSRPQLVDNRNTNNRIITLPTEYISPNDINGLYVDNGFYLMDCIYDTEVNIKDYGKTWALTKEGLE